MYKAEYYEDIEEIMYEDFVDCDDNENDNYNSPNYYGCESYDYLELQSSTEGYFQDCDDYLRYCEELKQIGIRYNLTVDTVESILSEHDSEIYEEEGWAYRWGNWLMPDLPF